MVNRTGRRLISHQQPKSHSRCCGGLPALCQGYGHLVADNSTRPPRPGLARPSISCLRPCASARPSGPSIPSATASAASGLWMSSGAPVSSPGWLVMRKTRSYGSSDRTPRTRGTPQSGPGHSPPVRRPVHCGWCRRSSRPLASLPRIAALLPRVPARCSRGAGYAGC